MNIELVLVCDNGTTQLIVNSSMFAGNIATLAVYVSKDNFLPVALRLVYVFAKFVAVSEPNTTLGEQ